MVKEQSHEKQDQSFVAWTGVDRGVDGGCVGGGAVTGQAQIDNRAIPGRLHIQIDCLNIFGNIAALSGTVTYSTEAGVSVGGAAVFGVEDNGEGAGASPDRITTAYENTGLVCTDFTPANVGL